ncbi:MAG: hypothetical protein E8D49_01195 [Nitrospira sp.]|nr:MAG: hypothetical protein E8D49_01195 [Nitrospira sp.]
MGIMSIEELTKPLFSISDDLQRSEKELLANDDSYSRRNYIRALFAVIELSVFVLKRTLLIAALSCPRKLTFAERALLHEETFDLTNTGEVRTQKKFLKLADNLRFTIQCVDKHFGLSLNFNPGDRNWKDFKETLKIRNRITHPKGHKDFDVSKEEAELAVRVGHWFEEFLKDWFLQFIATVKPVYESDAAKEPNR